MTSEVVFDNVSKKFRRGERHDSLRDLVPSLFRRALRAAAAETLKDQEFWALRNVSFDVSRGQALGIIGGNGAGKSTTLKLLTRILRPTSGRCGVRGRVGALIEVAAGFHPDLTGRENVYLQAAIIGMSRAEASLRFDQIVEFSGIGEFIDTPLKRYSSGMNARLGFSVAAHLEPEVLIIDEVLSVGDAIFQARCLERIRRLKDSGVALVFVSHNLAAVESLCDAVCWLDKGRVQFQGDPRQAVNLYLAASKVSPGEAGTARRNAGKNSHLTIEHVELTDETGLQVASVESAKCVVLRCQLASATDAAEAIIGFALCTPDGHWVFGENSSVDAAPLKLAAGQRALLTVRFEALSLPEGSYHFTVTLQSPLTGEIFDQLEQAVEFSVVVPQEANRVGSVRLKTLWHIEQLSSADSALQLR